MLALRSGAPLLPVGLLLPAARPSPRRHPPAARHRRAPGRLRDDIARVTQELAHALRGPDPGGARRTGTCCSPTGPATARRVAGLRPGPSGSTRWDDRDVSMRVMLSCPYSLSLFGGVQGQVLGLARALRARASTPASSPRATGRRPSPGSPPSARARGAEQRLGRAHRHRSRRRPAHDRGAAHVPRPTCCTCTSRSRPGRTTPRSWAPRSPRSARSTRRAPGRNGWYETFRPGLKPMMRRLAVATAVSEEAKRQVSAHVRRPSARSCRTASTSPTLARRAGHAVARAGDRVRRPPRAAARASRCCSTRSRASSATRCCGSSATVRRPSRSRGPARAARRVARAR